MIPFSTDQVKHPDVPDSVIEYSEFHIRKINNIDGVPFYQIMAPELGSSVLKYTSTWGDIMQALSLRLDRLARFELLKLPADQRPPTLMYPDRFAHNTMFAAQDPFDWEWNAANDVDEILYKENITFPQGWKFYDDQLIKWYNFVEGELRKSRILEDIVIVN